MRKNPKQEKERMKKPGGQRPQPDSHELPDDCATHCDPLATKRNRYYPGRYLTAHDFNLEQGYFLSRHRLHNRLLHGWGIVCGLGVETHKNPNCGHKVIINPGIAIDCCGREIILDKPLVVEVWDPDNPPQLAPRPEPYVEVDDDTYDEYDDYDDHDRKQEGYKETAEEQDMYEDPAQERPEKEAEESGDDDYPAYLITICYNEELSEFAPALYDDGSCGEGVCGSERLEANRICETVQVHVIEWDDAAREKYAGCWPGDDPAPHPCRDDCQAHPEMTQEGCIDPACSCELCVPLALVRPGSRKGGCAVMETSLDFSGRREINTPREYLTHIVDLNWTHGGQVHFSELTDPGGMNGELRISFDRKLATDKKRCRASNAGRTAVGVNDSTVMVEIHRLDDVQYPLLIHHNDGHPPYVDDDGCTIVIPLEDELLQGRRTLEEARLHVTLRCDFILDCHCRAVDGDHLKGTLPSGNGTQGGTFESWFWVAEDDKPRHRRQRRKYKEAS